jgi:hypothetical protein
MANLTISVDQQLVRKARARAAAEGRSLSAVVGEMLEQYAGRSDAAEVLREIFAIADGSGAAVGEDGITWTRDELYDRAHLR